MSHAVIHSIAMTPTHDGQTALVVELQFAGGGRSRVQIDPESIHKVLSKAGAASATDLIGRSWSVVDVRETIFAGVHHRMADHSNTEETTMTTKLETHRDMARRMYEPQMTPRWPLGDRNFYTADGKPRSPWTVSFWGPLNGETSQTVTGEPSAAHSDEFEMYWSRIPDFRITDYKVWPTEEGWIARIIYEGVANDGAPVLAHQVDIVTVDESGRLVRLEWHCDSAEWINQVWTKSSGLPPEKVREVLAQPKGFDRLCQIALGRASSP